jgi:CRP-like cAMP-binding protein
LPTEKFQGKKLRVPAGVVMVSEGEQQTSAYLIVSGSVEVYKAHQGGRIVLARLGPGQFFGEMNLVLESARSASVVTLEPCVFRVITQELFNRLLQIKPKAVLPLLQVLFERLRMMNVKYLNALESAGHALDVVPSAPLPEAAASVPSPAKPQLAMRAATVQLLGDSSEMKSLLGKSGKELERFPFRLGRKTSLIADAFAWNDLHIPDKAPYVVSRNHCSIDRLSNGTFLVIDRGSRLGTMVNGEKVGQGAGRLEAPLTLARNTLVLGGPNSMFRFVVVLK